MSIWTSEPAREGLDGARDIFTRWLGDGYDLDAFHAVAAACAVERLDGDAPWLLIVSGSGNAKTETVSACAGAGAIITSTITSEGALLSATSKKEQAKDATGGLLRRIGERGVLVVKDVTSILSMNRDARASVLGALREVADGYWERNVGTDGGRSLTWSGRIVTIGAVTTAWDTHHGVIATMGDRFLLLRVDSAGKVTRRASGRQALANLGSEDVMRAELQQAVADLVEASDADAATLAEDDELALLGVADIVTLARTAVERDPRTGNVVDAHAPEAPTRLVKYLGQMMRGALAIGMGHDDALRLALRLAHDCVPPMRLAALGDVAGHPLSRTSEVAERLQKPRSSVDRVLQELHLLNLIEVETLPGETAWRYRVARDVDASDLDRLVNGSQGFTRKVTTGTQGHKEGAAQGRATADPLRPPTDISGDALPTTDQLPLPQDDPWKESA